MIEISEAVTGAKRAEISATIIRADGTIEELGVIAAADLASKPAPIGAIVVAGIAAIGAAALLRRATRT